MHQTTTCIINKVSMRYSRLSLFIALVFVITGMVFGQGIGAKAPSFSLKATDGKTISLSDFKGKIVIVDFWATWCPPCRKGIPDLIQLQKDYNGKVQVIGISVDTDSKDQVPGFIKSYGINYPILYSSNEVVKAFGGIEAIPTAFVIDKNGVIADKHVGLVPKTIYSEKIESLLKTAPKAKK